MTDDERAQLRRAWQAVGDALMKVDVARKIKDKRFWDLVNALLAFRMAMQETQVIESDEEVSDNDC